MAALGGAMAAKMAAKRIKSKATAIVAENMENTKPAGTTSADEAIQVSIRIRPLNKAEIAAGERDKPPAWEFDTSNGVMIAKGSAGKGDKRSDFDHVFGPTTHNSEMYDKFAHKVVMSAMCGINGTVFTYGQTGSGKTHSIMGSDDDPGVIPRSVHAIFDAIEQSSGGAGEYCLSGDRPECDMSQIGRIGTEYMLRVSYLEVYNEEINDLLQDDPKQGKNLKILKDDKDRGAIIAGLTEELVSSRQHLLDVVERGEGNRHYASTDMNATSSRSHTLYRLVLESKPPEEIVSAEQAAMLQEFADAEGAPAPKKTGGMTSLSGASGDGDDTPYRRSYLNLVDLAGAERQKKTGAAGDRLKEGTNINQSLVTLGLVIAKLGEAAQAREKAGGKRTGAPAFIPYRDSKLTRILKQSLGGNSKTSILCTMSAATIAMCI